MTTGKRKKKNTWLILVELPDELKQDMAEVAKRKDWSFRKTVKHAVEAYVRKELGA